MAFRLRSALAALGLIAAGSAQALSFDLSFIAGTSLIEQASFQAAANAWSSKFTDNVTVKLTVGTGSLSPGVLAQAGSRRLVANYSDIRGAMAADASSALDNLAVSNLTGGSSVGLLMNYTADNPNGAGSATGFVDNNGSANNSQIRLTAANARSLGFGFGVGGVGTACTDCDAFIQFNRDFAWDHDRSNGIDGSSFDFIGVALHEIGHAMGFVSGVDTMDGNSGGQFSSNQFTFVSTMDLFRWSAESAAAGVIDWRAGNDVKCFSVDRGANCGPQFSTGSTRGDGRQASHWKDNLGIGALDPTAARGELIDFSEYDLMAFDVIGWNRAVPEPAGLALALLALVAAGGARRRKV